MCGRCSGVRVGVRVCGRCSGVRALEIRLAVWGMQKSAETNAWIKVQLYLAHASIMFAHAKGMDIHL